MAGRKGEERLGEAREAEKLETTLWKEGGRAELMAVGKVRRRTLTVISATAQGRLSRNGLPEATLLSGLAFF